MTPAELVLEYEVRMSVLTCLWGKRFTHDVSTIADIVVPTLLQKFDIKPKVES